MFFHIDESGNTGNNLFDKNQPRLSYGLLSSTRNVEILSKQYYNKILKIIDDDCIHANVLGIGGLVEIAPLLIEIQKKIKFDFDYYFIEKKDYALVMFFDCVFDAGINEAVRWDTYWTPLRYLLIHKLSILFDDELLKKSWELTIKRKIDKCEADIVNLLCEVKKRTKLSDLDNRSKESIIDALNFGIKKPLSLDFGYPEQKIISPNAVGFQFVISAIARRTRRKNKKSVTSIILDRQTQFNSAQIGTHYNIVRIKEGMKNASEEEKRLHIKHPLYINFDPEDITHKGLTDKPLTISKSSESIGLQIVDVYLWIVNKILSGKKLPDELITLSSMFWRRSLIDGISLEGMEKRFNNFMQVVPKYEDIDDKQLEFINATINEHREKVKMLN